jgi:hypothetical protein
MSLITLFRKGIYGSCHIIKEIHDSNIIKTLCSSEIYSVQKMLAELLKVDKNSIIFRRTKSDESLTENCVGSLKKI